MKRLKELLKKMKESGADVNAAVRLLKKKGFTDAIDGGEDFEVDGEKFIVKDKDTAKKMSKTLHAADMDNTVGFKRGLPLISLI